MCTVDPTENGSPQQAHSPASTHTVNTSAADPSAVTSDGCARSGADAASGCRSGSFRRPSWTRAIVPVGHPQGMIPSPKRSYRASVREVVAAGDVAEPGEARLRDTGECLPVDRHETE